MKDKALNDLTVFQPKPQEEPASNNEVEARKIRERLIELERRLKIIQKNR